MQKGLHWTDRGSTKKKLKTKNRITVHEQQINNAETRQISLSEHLENCSKENKKIMVIPFYKVKRDDEETRKTMEAKLWRPISFQNLSPSLTNDGYSALSSYHNYVITSSI